MLEYGQSFASHWAFLEDSGAERGLRLYLDGLDRSSKLVFGCVFCANHTLLLTVHVRRMGLVAERVSLKSMIVRRVVSVFICCLIELLISRSPLENKVCRSRCHRCARAIKVFHVATFINVELEVVPLLFLLLEHFVKTVSSNGVSTPLLIFKKLIADTRELPFRRY